MSERNQIDSLAVQSIDSNAENTQASTGRISFENQNEKATHKSGSGFVVLLIMMILPLTIGFWLWWQVIDSPATRRQDTATSLPVQKTSGPAVQTGSDYDRSQSAKHQVTSDLSATAGQRIIDVKGRDFALIVERPNRVVPSSTFVTPAVNRIDTDSGQSDENRHDTIVPKRHLTATMMEETVADRPGHSATDTTSSDNSTAGRIGIESVYIVVKGDTLWDIARRYMGDPFRYPTLASLSHIRDPDLIYPGDRVRIIRYTPGSEVGQ